MGLARKPVLLALSLLLLWAAVAGVATMGTSSIPITLRGGAAAPAPDGPVRVLVWNLGYAGLGEESDFIADGGRMTRSPSRAAVRKNLDGIVATLTAQEFDIALLQEVAAPGYQTRGHDVFGEVAAALPDHSALFSADIATRLVPEPFALRHGLGLFSRFSDFAPRIQPITEEPGRILGLIKRRYHVQEYRLDTPGADWTFINVHLSAFDEGADVRTAQLREVLSLAEAHHRNGRAVVVGGDWNMRLAPTDFAHTSSEDALFWIHDFPEDALPDGWRRVFDPAHPTVRTNERPYVAGENYTTIIDGLVVSPNVRVHSARTQPLGFRFSDHQPVVFELSADEPGR